jgi:hypothetical protein
MARLEISLGIRVWIGQFKPQLHCAVIIFVSDCLAECAARRAAEGIAFEFDDLMVRVVERMRQDGFDEEVTLADFVAAVDAISQ